MSHFDKIKFAESISYHRNKKGWKQNKLAIKSGIAPGMIKKYESGESEPTVSKVCQLAEALDIDVGTLINGQFTDQSKVLAVFGMPVNNVIELLQGLDQWTEGDFSKLLELVHRFATNPGKLDQAHGLLDVKSFISKNK